MNPELLEQYRRELQHARDMGAQFAEEFPKIAGRLGLEANECSDPYVERLLEGFAFLAARVNLKIESSYSKLARHILEMVYPSYLAPTPSMLMAEFKPALKEGALEQGHLIKRGTRLRSQVPPDAQTECFFRTAHDVTLWPLSVAGMRVLSNKRAIEVTGIKPHREAKSAIALKLEVSAKFKASDLPINELSFYLSGPDGTGSRLYEQMHRRTVQVAVLCNGEEVRSPAKITMTPRGFEDSEALLPVLDKEFQGYRLMQEYFSFPDRFSFMNVGNLLNRIKRCESNEFELVFVFSNVDSELSQVYGHENFQLYCTPAINLFPKSADRIHLDRTEHEYQVIPNRTRPMDYEVHSVEGVEGIGSGMTDTQRFYPYYSVHEKRKSATSFYNIHREPRRLSSRQKVIGTRSSYIGSEVSLSLVDAESAPYRSDLSQLSVQILCTNRDLPLQMPVGKTKTDFVLDVGGPVDSIRCITGPTVPRRSRAHSRDAWNLVSILNMNYLSVDSRSDDDGHASAALLSQMLELFVDEHRNMGKRQLEGILSLTTAPVVRQVKNRSHIEITRGTQVKLQIDETAFEGSGGYLFGAVLERFFTRYCSINSFVELALESQQRDLIETWKPLQGVRQVL